MDEVKKVCINCSSCIRVDKGHYICEAFEYRDIPPFMDACSYFEDVNTHKDRIRKYWEDTYPDVFKDGEIDIDSEEFMELIIHLEEIASKEVYKWPTSVDAVTGNDADELIDVVISKIPDDASNIIEKYKASFISIVTIISRLWVISRNEGLLEIDRKVPEDVEDLSKAVLSYTKGCALRIGEGTDPEIITRWSLSEYESKALTEIDKVLFCFTYQATRRLQGGENIKALKALCWRYAPDSIRFEIDKIIEQTKKSKK